ncbi:hypothetical protein B0J17DRAFT_684048 [Rhizoctonia solani]|nr:hypothetical protein B0J17DRAFT_684048 [Rhizoctonia solani]
MSLKIHDAPGLHTDLNEDNRKKWSAKITGFMHGVNISPTLTPQFYDATQVAEGDNVHPAKVTWIGFPNIIALQYPNNERRWSEADINRDVQDEYLEWSVKRDENGKIVKVVFCNEGPEYFQFLGRVQPETLIKLYQDLHPGVDIKPEDIFKPGPNDELEYNPRNKWNSSTKTGTIMHLIQRNNTLAAEVDLVARATVTRKRGDGTIITNSDELIVCSRNGGRERNSDPAIGAAVNGFARNPVGLYIDSVNVAQIQPPDEHLDEDVNQFFKFTRGADGWHTRLEFEVPEGKGFVLGDLSVRGEPLRFGSQLADLISVSATVRMFPSDKEPEPRLCGAPPPAPRPKARAIADAAFVSNVDHEYDFEGCELSR